MPFLEAMELVVIALVMTFVITQMLIPLLALRPLFPMFRKRNEVLLNKMKAVNADLDQAHAELEIARLEEELQRLRKPKVDDLEAQLEQLKRAAKPAPTTPPPAKKVSKPRSKKKGL